MRTNRLQNGEAAHWNGNGHRQRELIDVLVQSSLFQNFERAFSEATGLPVAIAPVQSWRLPFHGQCHENPFCSLMSSRSRSCATCLQAQAKLIARSAHAARTITCPAGLCETAVPVRVGEQLIGFLRTGQVFRHPPPPGQLNRVVNLAKRWGLPADRRELQKAYSQTPLLSAKRYESVVRLLEIFAQHISLLSNQLLIRQNGSEPPMVARARSFIEEHHAERLSLGQVAAAMHTNVFNFCKVFRKVTGINFTAYVSRVRAEKAKNLLLNPNLRVSEIAYRAGFQSLTHFNRMFKRYVGEAPTHYRARLPSPRSLTFEIH